MDEDVSGSPPGVSWFEGTQESRKHKVLLSYQSVDKYTSITKTWSFQRFKDEVQKLFPKLHTDFKLIDADFLELEETSYVALRNSTAGETWLLVHCNEEDSPSDEVVLDKPCCELLKYDVHPNALTESGNYHFSSCYQAFCEFIDNAVQATNFNEDERIIKLHVFEDWKITCVFDNGMGMTSEGMKAFASYFLSREDRGLEKGCSETFGYLDGNISKFGVGATQAGFYLGDTIKVVTKKADSKFVTEVSISKKKLHERAKQNLPVFEDYKWIRSPGDISTLDVSQYCLKELVASEKCYSQFTYVVITGVHEKHLAYISNDDGKDLARDLAHVYYFYIHGGFGKLEFDRISLSDFQDSSRLAIAISIVMHRSNGSHMETFLEEVDDDIESLYQQKAKSVFPFCLELNTSEKSLGKHVVQGCLLYFPNDLGVETLPRDKNQDRDRDGNQRFECFWQGRLAPLSYVNKLEFCSKPDNRSRKQRDVLPDACFNRIRGLLFFNRNTPVSNNKLKILLDTSMDLSDALSSAATSKRNLAQSFRQWLEECHRNFDKEIIFMGPLPVDKQPNNGDLFCGKLKIITNDGDIVYATGDIVKIDTRPVAYGKVMYFIQKRKVNEPGTVIFSKLPEEIYGDSTDERPVMRLAGKPDKVTLNKYIAGEMVHMPKTIRVFEGDDRLTEVADTLEFLTGESMKAKTNFWVAIYNGEKPPKNIVDLHHKKLSVKVQITGMNPLVNGSPVLKYYGFKPFYLDKVGRYIVTFSVLIANHSCGAKKEIEINIKPNIAEIVNLLDNRPDVVPLGESCIEFTLSFHDIYENPTTMFKGGLDYVILKCTSKHLEIQGLKEKYKPNKNGELKVSGLSVVPSSSNQISLTNDYEFWIVADNIGDVMFAVKLQTGPPCKVKMTKLSTLEFQNYENFPEIDVKVLDKHNQPAIIQNSEAKLALICDAFVSPVMKSNVTNGKAKFPTTSIKVENFTEHSFQDVKISLIIPELRKKKLYVGKVIKELLKFEIKILPSNICKRIKIIKDNVKLETFNDCLSLEAVAGSMVKNLKIVGFSEGGKQLSDDDLLSQDLHITTTWAEVTGKHLPYLPDCPVTNIIQVNVQNVQCFCKYNGFEIRNEAKLRISVTAGSAVKWSFQPLSLSVVNGKNKDLTDAVKIIALDKHHNPTLSSDHVVPIITAEHSKKNVNVEYSGSVVFKKNAFYFTPASVLNGTVGQVTLHVHDEQGVLTKDTISVELNSGPPTKIVVSCKAFEKGGKNPETPFIRMYARSAIPYSIVCNIADSHGNHTPTKTSLTIEWSKASMGKCVVRGTQPNGEVTFPANSLRCNDIVEKARLKIHSQDVKSIQPFWIDVEVLQCNRVTKIITEVEGSDFNACSNFPVIKVSHETEDSVPAPNFMANLTLQFKKPSGGYISLPNVYPPLQVAVEGLVVVFTPQPDHPFEESGQWIVSCTYTETRAEIKQLQNTALIGSSQLTVKPGPVVKLCLSIPDGVTLFASSTSDVKGRTLIPYTQHPTLRKNSMLHSGAVFVSAVDEHGNKTTLETKVKCSIEAADDSILGKDGVLPQLENNCKLLKMKDGCVELRNMVLKQKVGNKIGTYHLVFSDGVYKPCKIPFFFSTNEELEKVTQELEPLRNEMTSLGLTLKLKQSELAKKRTMANVVFKNVSVLFTDNQPDLPTIDFQIAKIRNENQDFETREQVLRQATKDRNYPPNSVRQYIKGLVCELAYVSDLRMCTILSWFAQAKLKVALTQNKEQQRKVYDLGCPAYSETLISGFQKKGGYDPNGLLPIDLPRPPGGFRSSINFAVNLLEFTPRNAYLRGTLFYSVFSNTIVLSDLDHAQKYREHLLKSHHRCPAILTMGGDVLAGDGLMDPNRRCPPRLDQLRYTFGELPPTEKPEYQTKLNTLRKLNELRESTSEVNLVRQEVQQCEIDLKERQKMLQPRITQLEEMLSTIREKAEQIPDAARPPPSKKKKR